MCRYVEENGDYNYTQFYTQRGDNEEYWSSKISICLWKDDGRN